MGKITKSTQRLEYIACKNKFVYWLTSLYYRSIIKREVLLAGITADDNILCIGGGPCPLSAILIHKYTGAKVTVIDNADSCVVCSQQLITRKGLSKGISIIRQEGESVCASGYTVVHFAAQISPLESVFLNVRKKCLEGTKFLIRVPKAGIAKLYSCMDKKHLSKCSGVKHSAFKNLDKTVLYVKTA